MNIYFGVSGLFLCHGQLFCTEIASSGYHHSRNIPPTCSDTLPPIRFSRTGHSF